MNRKLDRGDSGAAVVEFALLLPLLLLLVLGILDFGRVYNAQITLTQAAREGARYAALKTGDPVARTTTAASPLTVVTATVQQACPASPGPTDTATVRATKTINDAAYSALSSIANRFGGGISSSITITGTATMRCLG